MIPVVYWPFVKNPTEPVSSGSRTSSVIGRRKVGAGRGRPARSGVRAVITVGFWIQHMSSGARIGKVFVDYCQLIARYFTMTEYKGSLLTNHTPVVYYLRSSAGEGLLGTIVGTTVGTIVSVRAGN